MLLLDFYRAQKPLDKFLLFPFICLMPFAFAALFHDSIVTAHGPGAFGVTIVTTLTAAVLGAQVTHKFCRRFPASFAIGILALCVVELVLCVAEWHRLALILIGFGHAAVLTGAVVFWQQKQAERAAVERTLEPVYDLEASGGVRFSMQSCGDSACYCSPTKGDVVLRA